MRCTWKVGGIERNRFGLFYFDQCQPDDVIYCIYDSRFLKSISMNCKDFRNRGWGIDRNRFCSIFRKPASDLLSEDQVYRRVRGLDGKLCDIDSVHVQHFLLGGLVVCMSPFRGRSFYVFLHYFCFVCFSDFHSNLWLFLD